MLERARVSFKCDLQAQNCKMSMFHTKHDIIINTQTNKNSLQIAPLVVVVVGGNFVFRLERTFGPLSVCFSRAGELDTVVLVHTPAVLVLTVALHWLVQTCLPVALGHRKMSFAFAHLECFFAMKQTKRLLACHRRSCCLQLICKNCQANSFHYS